MARPLKVPREELLEKLAEYIYRNPYPILAEFAVNCGYNDHYLQSVPEFSEAIKDLNAKKRAYLDRALSMGPRNPTGLIFCAKNAGMKDTFDLNVTGIDPVIMKTEDGKVILGLGGTIGNNAP